MNRIAVVLIGVLVMLALVACSAGTVATELDGPTSVARDDVAVYDATTTGLTPLIAQVEYMAWVDVDGDGVGESNERLFNWGEYVVPADRMG